MADFKCNVCGGKVVDSEREGWFLCEDCGAEYPLEWMKAQLQKPRPAQAEGGVKAGRAADAANLYKRACLLLEDEKWQEADAAFDRVLDMDAEYAAAYVGKLCVRLKIHKESDLAESVRDISEDSDWQKALRFADQSQKNKYRGYMAAIHNNQERRRKELADKREECKPYASCIAASFDTVIGLKKNGAIVINGGSFALGQEWSEFMAVAAGGKSDWSGRVFGLKTDGTVRGYSNIEKSAAFWRGITALACGADHVLGLKSDGTVLAAGNNCDGQCDVSEWRDITAIAAGRPNSFTVQDNHYSVSSGFSAGLKSDGTVAVAGKGCDGQENISAWRDIVAISAGTGILVGLKADGSLVSSCNTYGPDLSYWQDIVAVSVWNKQNYVALKRDGTIIWSYSAPFAERWRDIAAVAAGGVPGDYWFDSIVGLKKDGTVVWGWYGNRTPSFSSADEWHDIGPVDVELAKQYRENQTREWVAQGRCRYCGGPLGGLFAKKCKYCGKPK